MQNFIKLFKDMENSFYSKIETPRDSIFEECRRRNFSEVETQKIYEYYERNYEYFKINPKMSILFSDIVDIIALKLNLSVP